MFYISLISSTRLHISVRVCLNVSACVHCMGMCFCKFISITSKTDLPSLNSDAQDENVTDFFLALKLHFPSIKLSTYALILYCTVPVMPSCGHISTRNECNNKRKINQINGKQFEFQKIPHSDLTTWSNKVRIAEGWFVYNLCRWKWGLAGLELECNTAKNLQSPPSHTNADLRSVSACIFLLLECWSETQTQVFWWMTASAEVHTYYFVSILQLAFKQVCTGVQQTSRQAEPEFYDGFNIMKPFFLFMSSEDKSERDFLNKKRKRST